MLTEYRNKQEFLRCLIDIHQKERFALHVIERDPVPEEFDTMYVGDIDSFIRHGRLFRSFEDALARHEAVKAVFKSQNNDGIFDAEMGEMLIDVTDDEALKHHAIAKDEDGDVELWTLSLSRYEAGPHVGEATAGLFVEPVIYRGGTYLIHSFWDSEDLIEVEAPIVLFANRREAEKALPTVEALLDDKPHPMDYWMTDDLFRVDLDESCFLRESSRNLPDFFFDTYAPELNKQDSQTYAKMKEIVECEEGLYIKSGSHFNIEMVLCTADGEWHFRDDKVLADNRWLSIGALYPLLGINTEAALLRALGIKTETVVLTQENSNEYIGRTLATSVFHRWVEDFVDEDTGDIVQIERSERMLELGEVVNEWTLSRIEAQQKPIEATFVKEDEEMLRLMQFIGESGNVWCGLLPCQTVSPWEHGSIGYEYLETHTRLSEIGRRRLDKALYGTFNRSHYHSSQTYHVTPRDFIEILKMLAKAGADYHPMTDVPAFPTDEPLEASTLAGIRSKHIGSQRPQLSSMAAECLEIDYLLHQ